LWILSSPIALSGIWERLLVSSCIL
jgi:hypothetical protein